MKVLKAIAGLAFILIMGIAGSAQTGLIRGRVMFDTIPLAGATVEIKKLKRSIATDESGWFSLGDILAGNYILHVSVIGFEPVYENIHL